MSVLDKMLNKMNLEEAERIEYYRFSNVDSENQVLSKAFSCLVSIIRNQERRIAELERNNEVK